MSETTQKKVCSPNKGCGQEKDISEFNKKITRNGYTYVCKECERKLAKQYRENNVEKIKNIKKSYWEKNKEILNETQRKHRRDNKEKTLLTSSKHRAKEKGLEHNITLEDIQIPEYCPVLGIKIDNNNNKGFKTGQRNSPSIDRIDNNKGYVKGNIKVISYRANWLKSDATIEELQKVLDYMKGIENDKQL